MATVLAEESPRHAPQLRPVPLEQAQHELHTRLAGLKRALRLELLFAGAARAAVLWMAAWAALLAFDYLLRPEPATRAWIFYPTLLALAGLTYLWSIRPALTHLSVPRLSQLLDTRFPGAGFHISNILELPDLQSCGGISGTLTSAAVTDSLAWLEGKDLLSLVAGGRKWKRLLLLAACGACVGFMVWKWPLAANIWGRRWLSGEDVRWPQATYMTLDGLNAQQQMVVPKGEPVELTMRPAASFAWDGSAWSVAPRKERFAGHPDQPPASVAAAPPRVQMDSSTGETLFPSFESQVNAWTATLRSVNEPWQLTLSQGDDWWRGVQIIPVDRPYITALYVETTNPATGQVERQSALESSRQLGFLLGTQIHLVWESSEPVAACSLKIAKGDSIAAEMLSAKSGRFPYTLDVPLVGSLVLTAQQTGLASLPWPVSIMVKQDRPPQITLQYQGIGTRVSPKAKLPFSIRATDDLGLTRLQLAQTSQTPVAGAEQSLLTTEIWPSPESGGSPGSDGAPVTDGAPGTGAAAIPSRSLERELKANHVVDLQSQSIAIGTSFTIQAWGLDNAQPRQQGQSRAVSFQVEHPDRLFHEILQMQRQQRAKFTELVAKSLELTEQLPQLSTEEQANAWGQAHQQIQREIAQVANRLAAAGAQMEMNELGNETARETLTQKVVEPLKELTEHTMRGPRAEVALWNQGGRQNTSELQSAEASQRAVQSELERVLSSMSKWEGYVDIVNQLQSIITGQETLLDATRRLEDSRTEGIFDE